MGAQEWNNVGARMKALFITPPSHEPRLIVAAWDSFNGPATHRTFDIWGEPDDKGILQTAKDANPDIIFYVGAHADRTCTGLPSHETFQKLRTIAPSVHLCWDATDIPWHATLVAYKKAECFNLQVAMDGGVDSPVDMATLTPIDPRPYKPHVIGRGIRCAFAGQNAGRAVRGNYQHPRWHVLNLLVKRRLVEFRERTDGPYSDYATYLKGCQMLLNISHTGSGKAHHVKVRITEAGMAGCALLEMKEAPTRNWVPEDCLFIYDSVDDAANILHPTKGCRASRTHKSVTGEQIKAKAAKLSAYIRTYYSPQAIYGSILERL